MRNKQSIDVTAFVAHAIVIAGKTTAWLFPGEDKVAVVNVFRITTEGRNQLRYSCSSCGDEIVDIEDLPCIHIVAERVRLNDHHAAEFSLVGPTSVEVRI